MLQLRRLALCACAVVLALSGALALAAPGGAGTPAAPHQTRPADLSLEGVEVDFNVGGVLFANLWSVPAGGGSAQWTPAFGTASYQFPLPASIPSTGAPVTLGVSVTAAPTARFAPALSVFGEIDVQGAATQVSALAEPGQSASGSLAVTLVPRASTPGSVVTVSVGLLDGPRVNYRYRASDACAPGATITAVSNQACPAVPKCNGRAATIFRDPADPIGPPIFGTPGDDVIVGGAASDQIFGRAGKDLICGRGGNDLILGNAGADHILGNAGDDTIRGGDDASRDILLGGADDDRIFGGGGGDHIEGGPDTDRLYGQAGHDSIFGGSGADLLLGGADSDDLYGGRGPDILDGGGPGSERDWGDGGSNIDDCNHLERRVNCER